MISKRNKSSYITCRQLELEIDILLIIHVSRVEFVYVLITFCLFLVKICILLIEMMFCRPRD